MGSILYSLFGFPRLPRLLINPYFGIPISIDLDVPYELGFPEPVGTLGTLQGTNKDHSRTPGIFRDGVVRRLEAFRSMLTSEWAGVGAHVLTGFLVSLSSPVLESLGIP